MMMTFRRRLAAVLTVGLGLGPNAFAAPAPDAEIVAMRRELATLLADVDAPQPAADAVGDAESFGRGSRWLGLMYTGTVLFASDCTPSADDPPGADDRCVTVPSDASLISFDLPDIGRHTLPARSANSLLCHWLSPMGAYTLMNGGTTRVDARFHLVPYVVIESTALADPSLIDATTGQPFAGRLESGFSAIHLDQRHLEPGQRVFVRESTSRTCMAGFLSRRGLVQTYGLTEAQATAVFRGEITLRFGLRGSARSLASGVVAYGLRVLGD